MSTLTAARRFRAAHHGQHPLVLPNVWDCASARVFAEAGFGALATSSSAVAAALGYADGQRTPAAEMFAAIARIARCVDVPVTADIEAGYGLAPAELAGRHGTWTGPTTRTRATPGPSPSTRSCSGSPAARSGWCTRRTGSACLAGTPGSGCCARPVSGRRW